MPPSAAETYLSAIAPGAKFQPCAKGFHHTVKVCMGSKNAHEIGRRSVWCHGGNRECNVKGPVLSIAEQDILRKKLEEFKKRLKDNKKEVSSIDSPRRSGKRKARSPLPEESSDEEQASESEPTPNDTVKVHMYFGDNAAESHDGLVLDGMYSFRADERFCEWSGWPKVRWLMFDVVQKTWVDIPTFASIEMKSSGLLLTRQNDPDADLSTYEGLNSLIKEALDTYTLTIGNSRIPVHAEHPLPSSQTTSETSSQDVGSSRSRKRARRH